MQAAARELRLELHVLNASTEREFDAVFAEVIRLRAAGLVIGGGAFFTGPRLEQLAALAVRNVCRRSLKATGSWPVAA